MTVKASRTHRRGKRNAGVGRGGNIIDVAVVPFQQDQPASFSLAHRSGCEPPTLGLTKDCRPTAGKPQPLFVRFQVSSFFSSFFFFLVLVAPCLSPSPWPTLRFTAPFPENATCTLVEFSTFFHRLSTNSNKNDKRKGAKKREKNKRKKKKVK